MVQMVRGQASCLSGSIIEWEMHLVHNNLQLEQCCSLLFFFLAYEELHVKKKKKEP